MGKYENREAKREGNQSKHASNNHARPYTHIPWYNASTMQNQLEEAISIACAAHKGQRDKGGKAYILHPLRVMAAFDTVEEKIVAVLHDVVEDSDVTLDQLRERGIDSSLVEAVDAITHRKGESYDDYLDRVAANPIAGRVKLKDIRDNIDSTRLPMLTEKDVARIGLYHSKLRKLEAAVIARQKRQLVQLIEAVSEGGISAEQLERFYGDWSKAR